MVELPGLQEKEDIVDWAEQGGNDKERLNEIIENTPIWVPSLEEFKKLPTDPLDTPATQKKVILDPSRTFRGILIEIRDLVLKYIDLPNISLATLISLWIAGTYSYKCFDYYGYLALRSATPRCGKTRLLKILSLLSKGKPPISTIPTAAVLFRSSREVLILDEVDRLKNADRETFGDVLAILNSGFEKGGTVERVEKTKEGYITKEFNIYGPKAIAGIESLADTLSDRTFSIQMRRATKRFPRLNPRRLENMAKEIRCDLEYYAKKLEKEYEAAYDGLADEVKDLADFDDRFQDISEPLLVVATFADLDLNGDTQQEPIKDDLLIAFREVSGGKEVSQRERELKAFMELVKGRWDTTEECIFISSEDLVLMCGEHEDLSRIDTVRKLAYFLKNFDLKPDRDKQHTKRGYWLKMEWFEEWQKRYGAVVSE